MLIKLRFKIPHAGQAPLDGQGIIVLVKRDMMHPLVLLVDEQENNPGVSLINSIETVIAHVERKTGISHVAMQFVYMDNEGLFDEVGVIGLGDYRGRYSVTWNPLKSPHHSRTLNAFMEKHGVAAAEVIEEVLSMVSKPEDGSIAAMPFRPWIRRGARSTELTHKFTRKAEYIYGTT